MGMYDTIRNELFCPFCGAKQRANDLQTKDFKCCLSSLDILDIKGVDYEIYATCFNCNNRIGLSINKYLGVHTLEEGKKQIEERRKDSAKLFRKHKNKICKHKKKH